MLGWGWSVLPGQPRFNMPYRRNSQPIYMYHAILPPKIVFGEEDKQALVAKGYGTEYIRQEYPKHVQFGHGRIAVRSKEEEEEDRVMARLQEFQSTGAH
jgi:hypothetical protein